MKKYFIVTGTSRGIGKQIAEHYLALGNAVAGCSRGRSDIKHEQYLHFELDVSDENSVVSMVDKVNKDFGKIDILLNNAGIASMNHLLTTPMRTANSVFNTNFFGTFLFTREVAKAMIRRREGCIVNYTTVARPLNLAGEAVYTASKAAIESLTRISAKELGSFGIRVNAIGPAPIATDMIRNIPQDKLQILIDQQVVKRLGKLDDIINVIDFFVSERSDFITGQTIFLGGVVG
ncbi:MAG: SDR family NAD(P)-dependent oxidoreductase [Cylindrospermopsis raciborskii]|jgi:3-oxoacyl-[acyl-carrier protein] reductase|uniref:SDR family NAD(P)-dependent oxidoreductase n=1 Tax=Cylindrospermopsis raciborskii TaxID=77022 RepID=UPI003D0EFD2F